MTDVTQPPNDRIEPRFKVRKGREVHVVLQRHGDGEPAAAVSGRLVDLSRKGAKLAAGCSIPLGEVVRLELRVPEVDLDWNCSAEVRWSGLLDVDTWHLGCMFDQEMPADVMHQLASSGFLERRQATRRSISGEATVRKELARGPGVRAQLEDLSTGGFRIVTEQEQQVGDRLLLELCVGAQRACIPAKVRWQKQVDDGFRVGCSFLNVAGFERMQTMLRAPAARDTSKSKSRRLPKWWTWVALACVLIWSAVYILIS